MARVASDLPAETDLLCEGCGYRLNGLPADGNCPECGKPVQESTSEHRRRSPFERSPSPATFARTLGLILGGHRRFFLATNTRSHAPVLQIFAAINILIASVLFAAAATGHYLWIVGRTPIAWTLFFFASAVVIIFGLLLGLTKLAAWLSAIEAKYWGMRLPHEVVIKGLHYHSADYLPVGVVAVAMVWGYRFLYLSRLLSRSHDDLYLYALCGLVILSAGYLFRTYWIAMRSMMFANR